MNPKEKAKNLYDKYMNALNITDMSGGANRFAKACALIAVDEIINSGVNWTPEESYFANKTEKLSYWQQVKNEITNL